MTVLKEDTPLRPKMQKYARRVAETGEIIKSATDVGYRGNYGSQLMKNPKILTAIQQEMDNLNVDTHAIVRKIKEGLNAYRVIKDGGKKYKDFHAQHKFLDMALKIRGDYAPEKHEIKQEKLILVITAETIKGLKDAEAITEADAEIITAEAIEEKDATG
jgi:hypothetical protein